MLPMKINDNAAQHEVNESKKIAGVFERWLILLLLLISCFTDRPAYELGMVLFFYEFIYHVVLYKKIKSKRNLWKAVAVFGSLAFMFIMYLDRFIG